MTEPQAPLPDRERPYRATRLAGDPEVAVLDLGGALTGRPIASEEEALLALAVLSRYQPLRQLLILALGETPPSLRLGEIARAAYRQNFKVTVIASDLSRLTVDPDPLLVCCQTVAWQAPGLFAVAEAFERLAATRSRDRIADVGLLLPAEEAVAPPTPSTDFILGTGEHWRPALPLLVDPRWQLSLAERIDTALIIAGEGSVWVGADQPVLLGHLSESNLDARWETRPQPGWEREHPVRDASGFTSLWRKDPGVFATCRWPLLDGDQKGGVLERLTPESPDCAPGLATHLSRYQFASHLARGKRVLDVGCGVGYGSDYLAAHGAAEVVAVDVSEEAIAYARLHYRRPNLTYLCADALELPDDLGRFDVVVAYEVFEHVPDGEQFLDALCERLHNDGVLVVSTPNKLTFSPGHPSDSSPNQFHVREYYRDEFTALLDARFKQRRLYGQLWERNFLARRREASFGAETRAVLGRQIADTREELRRLTTTLTDQGRSLPLIQDRLEATEASVNTILNALQRLRELEAGQLDLRRGLTDLTTFSRELAQTVEHLQAEMQQTQAEVQDTMARLDAVHDTAASLLEADARQDQRLLEVEEETLRLLEEMRVVVRIANGNFASLGHLTARMQVLARSVHRALLLRLQLGGYRAEVLHEVGELDLGLLDLPALDGDPGYAARQPSETGPEKDHHA